MKFTKLKLVFSPSPIGIREKKEGKLSSMRITDRISFFHPSFLKKEKKQFIIGMIQGLLAIILGWAVFHIGIGEISDLNFGLISFSTMFSSALLFKYSRNIERGGK